MVHETKHSYTNEHFIAIMRGCNMTGSGTIEQSIWMVVLLLPMLRLAL